MVMVATTAVALATGLVLVIVAGVIVAAVTAEEAMAAEEVEVIDPNGIRAPGEPAP